MSAPGQAGRSRLTLIILVLLTITVITLDLQDFGPLKRGQATVRDGVEPVTAAGDSVFSPVTNAWKSLTDYDDLQLENESLRAELDELRGTAISGQAAVDTLDELLREIDIDILSGVDTTLARVTDPTGNFDDFTVDIDRGSRDGLLVGMPAVTGAGLVGKVVEVEADRSQVELITEAGFGLGVRIIGPGDIALARGVGRGEHLEAAEGVADGSRILQGMSVVTSGIEGSPFPPDIPVGVVAGVEVDGAELQQKVLIRPVADLERLTFVTIILWSHDADLAEVSDTGSSDGAGE